MRRGGFLSLSFLILSACGGSKEAELERGNMTAKAHKGELVIPPLALEDSEGKEIARIWAAQGAQHVSLRIGQWPDPGAWE